jgi:Cof subfamily protein (haloacid dehalogenase superfamily)
MMKPHLLFFDLDGTLLFHGVVREEVREALRLVRERGHRVILNTGRSLAFVPPIVYELPFDGMICGASYVEYEGKVLLNRAIPVNLLYETVSYAIKSGVPICLEGVSKVYATVDGSDFENIAPYYQKILPTLYDITKMTVWRPISEEEAKILGRRFYLIRHETYTEIMMKGMTKGTGIAVIASHLGIPMERTVAFGDSLNDVYMLRDAGIAAVMKGAPDEVLALADWVATEEETGVAELLHKHFLQ